MKQDQSGVVMACPDELASMPCERCAIKCDEHEVGRKAASQQRGVVQSKPNSVLPIRDMRERKSGIYPPAGRNEPV
jgi:hypothetical protein